MLKVNRVNRVDANCVVDEFLLHILALIALVSELPLARWQR